MHAFETEPEARILARINERNSLFLALNVPIIVTDTCSNSSKLHLYTISPNEKECTRPYTRAIMYKAGNITAAFSSSNSI